MDRSLASDGAPPSHATAARRPKPGGAAILVPLAIGGVALSAAAFFLPSWAVFLGTIVLAKSFVVLGLAILWRAGLVSFGQALFYGLGAYAVALAGVYGGVRDFFVAVPLAALSSLILGFLLGFLLRGHRGIFFANLNLAFSMLLYGLLAEMEELGSTDGFHTEVPTFLGFDVGDDLRLPFLFTGAAVLAVLLYGLAQRFLQSTLGQMTTAIRDNEIRVEYIGYPVRRACHVLVTIAALLAGVGGSITALAVGHVDPELVYWTTSGEFVFVAILSGTGNVLAPILGTFVFELIRTYANQYFPFAWQLLLGGSLLLCILFLPNGLWSLLGKLRRTRE